MRNHTFVLVLSLALAACAVGRRPATDLAASLRAAPPPEASTQPPRAGTPTSAASEPRAPRAFFGDDSYTRLAFGPAVPAGDIDGLDTGVYGHVAFGTELLPILAIEASFGYLAFEGDPDQEVTALPALLSARVQLPLLVFEAYGGVGVGGMLADYDFGAADDTEFLLAGTAFAGLELGLGGVAVGLEYRYLTSEEADPGFAIEGHCGLVTLTLPF